MEYLKVVATHENTSKQITVLEGIDTGGAINGADRYTPSNMSLAKSGMWKFDKVHKGTSCLVEQKM